MLKQKRSRIRKETGTRKNSARKIRRRTIRFPARAKNPEARQPDLSFDWIRPLAEPYLRGYHAKSIRANGLRGFSFSLSPPRGKTTLGFFVGYLVESAALAHLRPAAPECLIFGFIEPIGGAVHYAQVRDAKGTVRWTLGYIRWLTHRPPHFEFYESERTALIRHASMRNWPAEKIEHLSRNFFTETLAWLVRSGLVRRWREFSAAPVKK